MRVEIREIRSLDDATRVRFSSESGPAWGRWAGRAAPKLGGRYSVELDVDGSIPDYAPTREDDGKLQVRTADGLTLLTGCLESVDDDGMGYLRLADDCLLMIETSQGWTEPDTTITLRVPIDALLVTPIGA